MGSRATTAATTRPNRILLALAAAWMAIALAIGGAVNAGNAPVDGGSEVQPVTEAAQR